MHIAQYRKNTVHLYAGGKRVRKKIRLPLTLNLRQDSGCGIQMGRAPLVPATESAVLTLISSRSSN
jgi:hypothetical protein